MMPQKDRTLSFQLIVFDLIVSDELLPVVADCFRLSTDSQICVSFQVLFGVSGNRSLTKYFGRCQSTVLVVSLARRPTRFE